jgi:BASS family bile acid:Na+ symporter
VDAFALVLGPCVVVFMVGSFAGMGLGLAPRDALVPLRHARFVALTLTVSWVVCPALAYLVLQVIPIERPYATGLLLLALAPCAPFAPKMVQTARGDPAYLAAFTVLSAIVTVVVMPVAVPILVPGLAADPLTIARPLILFVLVPLLVGTIVKGIYGRAAERLRSPVAVLTNVIGGVLMVAIAILFGRAVYDAIGSNAIVTQVVFLVAVALAAHVLGVGLSDEQRSVLTIGVCTRNLGAALAPLAAVDGDPRAIVMIAIGAPVTVAVSALVARWLGRRAASASALKDGPTLKRSVRT